MDARSERGLWRAEQEQGLEKGHGEQHVHKFTALPLGVPVPRQLCLELCWPILGLG